MRTGDNVVFESCRLNIFFLSFLLNKLRLLQIFFGNLTLKITITFLSLIQLLYLTIMIHFPSMKYFIGRLTPICLVVVVWKSFTYNIQMKWRHPRIFCNRSLGRKERKLYGTKTLSMITRWRRRVRQSMIFSFYIVMVWPWKIDIIKYFLRIIFFQYVYVNMSVQLQ